MPARLQVFELQLKAESSNTCTIPGASFGKGSIEALSSRPCLSPSHAFGQAPDPRKGRPHSQQDATPPRPRLLQALGPSLTQLQAPQPLFQPALAHMCSWVSGGRPHLPRALPPLLCSQGAPCLRFSFHLGVPQPLVNPCLLAASGGER